MPRVFPATILVLALSVVPALAGPREEAAAAMARCDLIRENAAWLDCHEKATTQMRAALSGVRPASMAPVPPPTTVSPQTAGAAQGFGADNLSRVQRPAARAPRKLVARVTDVSFSQTGYFTIGLDNGQWWRQSDGDVAYARFREPANRNVIAIEHGFMGSYNLRIQGLAQSYKVTRVR